MSTNDLYEPDDQWKPSLRRSSPLPSRMPVLSQAKAKLEGRSRWTSTRQANARSKGYANLSFETEVRTEREQRRRVPIEWGEDLESEQMAIMSVIRGQITGTAGEDIANPKGQSTGL
ncbi:hypothetical protein EV421DRAFT_1904406 [Armillaria borealis]|uniref:Uncharacterized protein n=1 Tax=Armillaria borealis TaxID=47425 RepID=A0AA39JG61_9AGAR|nr:hypothetical protein EV421DRAFT_1904406 [Armillaria borealis]